MKHWSHVGFITSGDSQKIVLVHVSELASHPPQMTDSIPQDEATFALQTLALAAEWHEHNHSVTFLWQSHVVHQGCTHHAMLAKRFVYVFVSADAGCCWWCFCRCHKISQNSTESTHLYKGDNHTTRKSCYVLSFIIRWVLVIHDSGRNLWLICQISAGLLCHLKGIRQKSHFTLADKVRVSQPTFCRKHSAQQMDSKLFDTWCLHSKGSLELIMETHLSILHPSEYLFWATAYWIWLEQLGKLH